jgi:hypothetical protein
MKVAEKQKRQWQRARMDLAETEHFELRKLVISKKQYSKFLKHYTFSALQGLPIGPAFCNYFDVDDFILLDSGIENTYIQEYIEKIYVEPDK